MVKTLKFKIPGRIASDQDGFEFLCHISYASSSARSQEIIFDFSGNDYFQENLCSPFGAFLERLKTKGNTILFDQLPLHIETEFQRIGFYDVVFPELATSDRGEGVLRLQKFALTDVGSFQDYINERLLSYQGFPTLSALLKKKINTSILEIFNNCYTHGRCDFVYTCGEFYPEESILRFGISDMGATIRANVNAYLKKSGSSIPGKDAIEWAVEPGNTTKEGAIPGGLGLSMIRDFLRLNEGSIQIISSNGYWQEKKGIIFANTLKDRFLGTIVNLEFNLNDNSSYMLRSEIDPKKVL
jgi:hypothetical protein